MSKENNPYYSNENTHGWLDKNGWLHRNANVVNKKNGKIYNLTFDIAKSEDGRTILYATDGKIERVGHAEVNSLKIKGSGQESDSTDTLSQKNGAVNTDSENNYQLTEQDTEYLALAKNPEKNEARLREMVATAAKAAGYVSLVYHGSESENRFNKFNVPAFFSSDKKVAKSYATESTDNVYSVYLSRKQRVRRRRSQCR